MALTTEEKLAITAKLRLGATPNELALQFNTGVQNIYGIKKKLSKELETELVGEIAKIPVDIVKHVIDEAKKVVPAGDKAAIESFDNLSSGIDGLKKLSMNFQTTVGKALKRFDELLDDNDTPLKDIKMIIDTTASAYEKVFASGTNIHIGDNNSQSNTQLSVFKNTKGI